jgi:RNA polymerase sigma factor (sigma-70 family)
MAEPTDDRAARDHLTSIHIERAIKNDRASIAWLVSRYTPLLLFQAHHRMVPSLRAFVEADDAVADVWMAVLSSLPRLAPAEGSFSLALIRFTSTVLNRRLRDLLEKHVLGKPGISPITDADEQPVEVRDATRGVIAHVVAEERKGIVWASLSALDPEEREIMVMRGIEGRSRREIGEHFGITPENVGVRYHRTLRKLRALVPASVLDDLEEE